ncbi:hypothetical protein BH20ACT3_BH20ACT3_06830 [soil metagenome]
MSQRRTLILVAAIVIGALSSFLVWNYVNGVEDEAFDDAEQVPVYLVQEPVTQGSSGAEAEVAIALDSIPRKFMPANAVTDIADISGQVAVNDLVPNQVVVQEMFVDPSDPTARISFADRLNRIRNEDQTAITIEVDRVRGVAGLIRPGDYVNLMVTQVGQLDEEGNPEGVPEDAAPEDVMFARQARYLYQKAEVLAVDQDALPEAGRATTAGEDEGTEEPTGEPANAGLITLIVPTRAAQYVASVPPENLYLVMVAKDYQPVPQSPIDPEGTIPAEDPSVQTPYGPNGPDSAE